MLLNTLNSAEILNSLAKIFITTNEKIMEYIYKEGEKIVYANYNDYTIDSLNIDKFTEFIGCSSRIRIDEIVVNHITHRKNLQHLMTEKLMNLPMVLTQNTVLSKYLKSKGFEFYFRENIISIIKDGILIDHRNLHPSNLSMRFGGENSLYDFNINGYLFINDFYYDECKGWLGSPEILKSLSNAFQDKTIANDYVSDCENYLLSFKAPLDRVDIENTPLNYNNDEKTDKLLKYSINALAHYSIEKKDIAEFYNPVLLLHRECEIPCDDFLKAWKLKIKYPKVLVKEI